MARSGEECGAWAVESGSHGVGVTVCTPRPKCDECPIQKTCRAYAEGSILAKKKQVGLSTAVVDIEDACTLCEQLDTEDLAAPTEDDDEEDGDEKVTKKKKTGSAPKPSNTISNYFAVKAPRTIVKTDSEQGEDGVTDGPLTDGSKKRKASSMQATPKSILTYCSLFPKKIPKKKPAEEECAVCVIELVQPSGSSKYLIEQRPAKGTLTSTLASSPPAPSHY